MDVNVCLRPDRKISFSIVVSSNQMKFFSDAGEFLERVQPFLVTREAEHCLILGLLDGLRSGEQFGAAPPLMADELQAKGVAIPGINGSADIARKFALKWCELSGHTFRVHMAQRIYQLSRVAKNPRAAGRLREPTLSDEALIRKWRAAFSMEAEGMDREQAEKDAALPLRKSRHLLLWEVEGAAVSMAGYSGRTPNGMRVAWVYTPPNNRGKGFAGACVAALSQKLLDDSHKFCFLYTDLANPVSNHVYQKIGYEPVTDATVYSFSEEVRR